MKQEQTIIFLHIPKTAGQTLGSIIDRQYVPEEIYDIHRYGTNISKAVEELINLPEDRKRKFKLVKGHYQFELHNFLPQSCLYMTFLRDPIDRIISHYYFVLRNTNHPLYSKIKYNDMNLDTYVLSGISKELNNGQCRMLSGMENLYEFGDCKIDLLDTAKENLEKHFIVPGIMEEFNKSLALTKVSLGWRYICYYHRNVSEYRPRKSEISKATLKNIERYNELDIELYEYSKKLFSEAISIRKYMVDKEVRKLKWQNLFYQPSIKIYHRARYYGRTLQKAHTIRDSS